MNGRSMVDANVLVYGFRILKPRDTAELRQMHVASLHLLKKMRVVRVCVIAWGEFIRGVRQEELEAQSVIRNKIRPEAADARVVDRAIQLMAKRQLHEKLCRKCLNAETATPCTMCKRLVSSKQLLNDAIVAASAELTDDVDVLYGYDSGIGDFVKYWTASRCELREPPDPVTAGLQLFEKAKS